MLPLDLPMVTATWEVNRGWKWLPAVRTNTLLIITHCLISLVAKKKTTIIRLAYSVTFPVSVSVNVWTLGSYRLAVSVSSVMYYVS